MHRRIKLIFQIVAPLIILALGFVTVLYGQSWKVRQPSVFRIDERDMERIYQRASEIAPPLESLLISRGNTLISEQYFGGLDRDDLANMKSASKSILSILVGIAIDQGYLSGVDQTIDEFFPEYFAENTNHRKADITIRDLITMRAGLETTSFYNYGKWVSSSNWALWALEQPMIAQPGRRMIYSTGNSHLVSVILAKATGMSTLNFAREYLFEPLGIRRVRWPTDPQGYHFGGNNMGMRPIDLMKIGQLYLNGGEYNGRQIVSRDWVKASVKQYIRSRHSGHYQGYYWWSNTYAGKWVFFAWGHGGQYCFVIPEFDVVVVFTSSLWNRNQHEHHHNSEILRMIEEYIIPAVQ